MIALGIDIGGTKISGALVDKHGNIVEQISVQTDSKKKRDERLVSLFEIVEYLKSGIDLEGIGIGSAGRIDHINGIVTRPTANIPEWEGLELKKIVEEKFQLPVYVDNDANVAALGEGWTGTAQGLQSYVTLTLGTGVGAGIVLNGELLYGSKSNGGELGHIPLYPGGDLCRCGLSGCVEQYISGNALIRKANLVMNDRNRKTPYTQGDDIFQDYLTGIEEVKDVVHKYIYDLTLVLTTIQNSFDPELMVIGGGVIHSKEIWWPLLMDHIDKLPISMSVVPALLDNKAGIIGAASMVYKIGLNQREQYGKDQDYQITNVVKN
jgi:glucokinase